MVGLDVHKASIVAAVLPYGRSEVTEKPSIENHPKAIEKLVNRIARHGPGEFVYEAGPCGYQIHRQITGLGDKCAVIAPSLTPVRPGDRVKTDARDAENLARFYRVGRFGIQFRRERETGQHHEGRQCAYPPRSGRGSLGAAPSQYDEREISGAAQGMSAGSLKDSEKSAGAAAQEICKDDEQE